MANYRDSFVSVEGYQIPLRVHQEVRKNVRVSVGKKHVHLRLPNVLLNKEVNNYLKWAEKWITKQFETDKAMRARFIPKSYKTGDTVEIQGKTYTLDIVEEDRLSHSGKIQGNNIFLKLSNRDADLDKNRAIKQLLSRLISHSLYPMIEKKVHRLNDQFFQKDITKIRIKYNSSNWGSCSSKGNVNLSSRLLFAPSEVIDYVIIHELAHLIELNHSPRFWKLVSDAMPSYKQKEQWLKKNGHLCDF